MKRATTMLMAIVLMGLSLSGVGCRKDPILVNISHAPVSILPEDYSKLRKRWTRKQKIIYKFDTTLDVYATLLSWEFRWAYVIKYSQLFKLSTSERKTLWARQEDELKETVQFVVAVACTDNKWNDLDKGTPSIEGPGKRTKGSIWRITLTIDDNDPVYPKEIHAIEPIRKTHKDMFPYIGHFHRLYRITFPRKKGSTDLFHAQARKITLGFAGPLGSTKLLWLTNNYIITKDEQ